MTLTELMVAMMVMTVSVYILSSTITATIAHSAGKRERVKARGLRRPGGERRHRLERLGSGRDEAAPALGPRRR